MGTWVMLTRRDKGFRLISKLLLEQLGCRINGLRHACAWMYGFRSLLLNMVLAASQSVSCREFGVVHALHLLSDLSLMVVLPERAMSSPYYAR